MNYQQNGKAAPEQWNGSGEEYYGNTLAPEYDDFEDEAAEYDDYDDESTSAEYDYFDDERYLSEYDDFDDESLPEFEDEDEFESAYGEADPELLGTLANVATGGIAGAVKGINRLISRKPKRRSYKKLRPKNYLKHRLSKRNYRVKPKSKLAGSLRTSRGNVPLRLPTNIALKTDVKQLANQVKQDVKRLNLAVSKNAAGIRTAIGLARAASNDVKSIDAKYKKITINQTKVSNALDKKVEEMKKQAQQQAMLSLFMQPELETITLKDVATGDVVNYQVESSDYESNLLPLFFTMGSGGPGGSGQMDPMMMFALMQSMND